MKSFSNSEMTCTIENDICKLKIAKKKIPTEKYFKGLEYPDKVTQEVVSSIIKGINPSFDVQYDINDEYIEMTILGEKTEQTMLAFISRFQNELRKFYDQNAVHITRMFGSYILIEKISGELKAIKATPIPIKYCPLMAKLLKEVGGETAEKLLQTLDIEDEEYQANKMCDLINEVVIKGGYFDTNRVLNSCEANVLFGASETMSSAFTSGLIDAAVIVSNNLGTIITSNESNTQGAVKRMTGLFYTSPSEQIMKNAEEANIIPVFPYTAKIDQIAGVKKAIELGYKSIAVSVAASDNSLHEELSKIETKYGITIYKFGLCSTGIDENTAVLMRDNADVIWTCASKQVKKHVEPKAIAQVGIKIPVHVMTYRGWEIISNHLTLMKSGIDFSQVELSSGDNKPVFLNNDSAVQLVLKKNIRKCTDCPRPCI